jgi:hypothetical protein
MTVVSNIFKLRDKNFHQATDLLGATPKEIGFPG